MTQVLLLAAAASVIAIYELTKTSDPDPPSDSGNGNNSGNNNPDPNANPPGTSNPAPGGNVPSDPATTPVTSTQTFQPLTSYSDQWSGQCHEFDPYWQGGDVGWGAYQDKGLAPGMESESTRSKPLCATLNWLGIMNNVVSDVSVLNPPNCNDQGQAALCGNARTPNGLKFDPTKVLHTNRKYYRYIVDGKIAPFTERDIRAFGYDDPNGNGKGKLMIDPSNRQAILDWMNAPIM